MTLQMCMYLNKGELADAGGVASAFDRDLSVMLNPPSPAQDVVHARRHLVPLIVITITNAWKTYCQLQEPIGDET